MRRVIDVDTKRRSTDREEGRIGDSVLHHCYIIVTHRSSTYMENTGVTRGRVFIATLCRRVKSEGERRCTSHRMDDISPVSLSFSMGVILCGER